ncbi:hypothetical protein G6F42_023269 [Rhizopus arrhizus]|nr:hypothetical protein G6F42_023269 [Rhizopus arrhizus]
MDQLYDASFYSWLKSEENVLVTAMYLHRIANEYPLVRIINALKWLISDWRLESISTLVRHVTVDWCDEAGNPANIDYKVKCVMLQEAARRERVTLGANLRKNRVVPSTASAVSDKIDHSLSSSTSDSSTSLPSSADDEGTNQSVDVATSSLPPTTNANPAITSENTLIVNDVIMETASLNSGSAPPTVTTTPSSTTTVNSEEMVASTVTVLPLMESNNSSSTTTSRRHHRRTSSNDVNDIKRLRLSTPDLLDQSGSDMASTNIVH